MAQTNYNDLLNFLGLSNWQFVVIVIVLLIGWAVIATFWKIGALKKVEVLLGIMPPLKCVYISYYGSYDHFDKIYSQSAQDFDMVFKFSNYFCIFYDDPGTQPQGASSKALIGVIVSQMQQAKIKVFLSKFPQYKVCDFPKSKSLRVQYPFIGSLSCIMSIGVVYPALQKKIQELKLNLKHQQIIQIYHSNQEMSIIVPIENEDSFQKWYEPTAYSKIQSEKDK